VSEIATPIGTTGYGVTRILLGAGEVGAHLLTATKPIGIQVMGYGEFTSYQYPGGLNLQAIAPPPVK
jgi:phosphoglycerate dehydrogenase-like enzyme